MGTRAVEVKDLSGPALDWAVAEMEGLPVTPGGSGILPCVIWKDTRLLQVFDPHCDWEHAGPVIDKYSIVVRRVGGTYFAITSKDLGDTLGAVWNEFTYKDGERYGMNSYQVRPRRQMFRGKTYLEAAMRCAVGTTRVKEVEVPTVLLEKEEEL